MIVITANQMFGVFKTVEVLEDRLLCDSSLELPFTVIGSYEISKNDSLYAPPNIPQEVPEFVDMWRARDVLIQHGLVQSVKEAIATIPDSIERERAFNRFEYAPICRRDDPILVFVVAKAGFSAPEVDGWFIEANSLQ